jgi:LemA protein
MNWTIIIVIALPIIAIFYFIAIYNGLVKLRKMVDNGWAQIASQLQRRYDLIPNLVETVKGYAAHEKEVFESVTRARAGLMGARNCAEQTEADNVLTGTLKTLFAVAEAYPELKANENFRELQLELTSTENKIAYARQFYNDKVMKYNTAIELFPRNIIAGMFGFKSRDHFVSKPEANEPPKVSF